MKKYRILVAGKDKDTPEQEFTLQSIFTHDGYNEETGENNIAIVKLKVCSRSWEKIVSQDLKYYEKLFFIIYLKFISFCRNVFEPLVNQIIGKKKIDSYILVILCNQFVFHQMIKQKPHLVRRKDVSFPDGMEGKVGNII